MNPVMRSRGLSFSRSARLVCILVFLGSASGCGLVDAIKSFIAPAKNAVADAVSAIDKATNALANQSADWQQVLKDLEGQLTQEAESTVRNDVANILSRSISQGGVELRCDGDFLRNRVREALLGLKAKLLGQAVPPPGPALCQVVPVAVDRAAVPDHVKQLEFYGYDFDTTQDIHVFLESTGGARDDVTNALDRPTHYAMTVKFGGNGVNLQPNSQRFVLQWSGKDISTVAVIQPETPVCQSKVDNILPSNVTYRPPKMGPGDAEFGGHGPHVTVTVLLTTTSKAVSATVTMDAQETQADWTHASGSQEFALYNSPPGWRVDQLVGPKESTLDYTDNTTNVDDHFDRPAGEPARHFKIVGDTGGSEAGTRTGVDIAFNELHVTLVQDEHCVADRALIDVRRAGLLTDATFSRLHGAADGEAERRRILMTTLAAHHP
jgi:hypothetical protein